MINVAPLRGTNVTYTEVDHSPGPVGAWRYGVSCLLTHSPSGAARPPLADALPACMRAVLTSRMPRRSIGSGVVWWLGRRRVSLRRAGRGLGIVEPAEGGTSVWPS